MNYIFFAVYGKTTSSQSFFKVLALYSEIICGLNSHNEGVFHFASRPCPAKGRMPGIVEAAVILG
ncbi:hypothetical protein CR164_11290 [Prosthecochloris marina]|uniref:Uncharacterized protein n=1 Tax=Prosthecochloris marina TaxID=2017681 RepID=A0A317T6F2_9CHLB|nr:hypothetical protein [Prosthecochloris sp. SCSIO W1102]PWW81317.1 hypothetical protein CR164_11290 [Prosthecochloris marina]UZJ39475.1 hypothetical protein OO185_05965 [Prosthecochloris sp. SCSIO W1102]